MTEFRAFSSFEARPPEAERIEIIPERASRARRFDIRRNRFVAIAKYVLPALGLGLLALIAVWPSVGRNDEVVPARSGRAALAAADPRMVSPKLVGVDRAQQPFTLTAASAARLPEAGERDVYELSQPLADIALNDGAWWALSAQKGIFWRDEQKLELEGDVSVYQDKGYEFITERAQVDLAQRQAHGDRPVSGVGPSSRIVSEGFRFVDRGQRLDFTGRTRLLLTDQKGAP